MSSASDVNLPLEDPTSGLPRWVTLQIRSVRSIRATHAISEFPIPTANRSILWDHGWPGTAISGLLSWMGNKIGMLNPATGTIHEYLRCPRPAVGPMGIAAGPRATSGSPKTSRQQDRDDQSHDPCHHRFPHAHGRQPMRWDHDRPDDNLWFTEGLATRSATSTRQRTPFIEFPSPPSAVSPARSPHGPDGNLWFTETKGTRSVRWGASPGRLSVPPRPSTGKFPGTGRSAGWIHRHRGRPDQRLYHLRRIGRRRDLEDDLWRDLLGTLDPHPAGAGRQRLSGARPRSHGCHRRLGARATRRPPTPAPARQITAWGKRLPGYTGRASSSTDRRRCHVGSQGERLLRPTLHLQDRDRSDQPGHRLCGGRIPGGQRPGQATSGSGRRPTAGTPGPPRRLRSRPATPSLTWSSIRPTRISYTRRSVLPPAMRPMAFTRRPTAAVSGSQPVTSHRCRWWTNRCAYVISPSNDMVVYAAVAKPDGTLLGKFENHQNGGRELDGTCGNPQLPGRL